MALRRSLVALLASTAACSLFTSLDGLGGGDPTGPADGADAALRADASFAGDDSDGGQGDPSRDASGSTRRAVVVVGGQAGDAGAVADSMSIAMLLDDGSVGPWKTVALETGSTFYQRFAVAVGPQLAVVRPSVSYVGTLDGDGKPTWTLRPGFDRESHCVAAFDDEVFVFGGESGGTDTAQVSSAPMSTFAWTATAPLPAARHLLVGGCAVTREFAYVLSGKDTSGAHRSEVWVARRGTAGGLEPWRATTALPSTAYGVHAVVVGSRLVVVGGAFDTIDSRSVLSAPIQADGSLGSWQLGEPLPERRVDYAVAAAGERIVVSGGIGPTDVPTSSVVTASVDGTSGQMTPWSGKTALPMARWQHSSAIVTLP